MTVTAYTAGVESCGKWADGYTASGKPVTYNGGRFVAADWTILPPGTRVRIPGYADGEWVEVIDRGGAIKGDRLDVFFPDMRDAKAWGRQTLVVGIEK